MPCPAASCTFAEKFAALSGRAFPSVLWATGSGAPSYAIERFCRLNPGGADSIALELLTAEHARVIDGSHELAERLQVVVENPVPLGTADELNQLKSALNKCVIRGFRRRISVEKLPWSCAAQAAPSLVVSGRVGKQTRANHGTQRTTPSYGQLSASVRVGRRPCASSQPQGEPCPHER